MLRDDRLSPRSVGHSAEVGLHGERNMSKGRPEVVASADSADAGYAAFEYGADAVCLGLRSLSARAGAAGTPDRAVAEGLTVDEVDAITGYAHSLEPRRRVYVALNTLALQSELGDLVEAFGGLADVGVDAVALQELGACRIARAHFPGLRLHASTRLAARSREGARTLVRIGFTRAAAAPELSLDEIRDISAVEGIDLEVLVHGALCYSYGGLCLFPAHALGPAQAGAGPSVGRADAPGRSANRGTCGEVCRVAFRIEGGSGAPGGGSRRTGSRAPSGARPEGDTCFPFSMKDLALGDHLDDLRAAGASALKIEGRKRSAFCVAAVTDFYRRLLDGKLPPGKRAVARADLRTVSSRPWTDRFIDGRTDKDVAGRAAGGGRGTPIGEVESVTVRVGSPRGSLRFRTSRRLELRDGLEVSVPGQDRPFGFAVEHMRLAAKSRRRKSKEVFEAPAGSTVEVQLPEEYPLIPPGTTVYCSSSQEVKQRYRHARPKPGRFRSRRAMTVLAELSRDRLSVSARAEPYWDERGRPPEASAAVAGPFRPAKEAAKTASAARSAFEKLGGTRFRLAGFDLRNPEGLFVPTSKLNRLRREVVALLDAKYCDAHAHYIRQVRREVTAAFPAPPPKPHGFGWSLKTDRLAHLAAFEADDWRAVEEVVVGITRESVEGIQRGLEHITEAAGRERVRLALPVITRSRDEEDLRGKVDALARAGWQKWQIAGVSGWGYVGSPGSLDITTDWPLYVTNRQTALQLLDMGASGFTLSPEDGLSNIKALLTEFPGRATVIVYQDTPLFVSGLGAGTGPAEMRMLSSFGDKVVRLGEAGRTVVIHREPFCLSDRLDEIARAGAASLRVDLVWRSYAPEEAREVWRTVREGRSVGAARVANFDRGLA